MMHSVFVTDGFWRKSLAAVRSLGSAGLQVHCGEVLRWAPALFSKYAAEKHLYPSPILEPQSFVKWLKRVCRSRKISVVLPMEFSTLNLIAAHKSQIPARILCVSPQKLLAASDKAWIAEFAHRAGISIPETVVVRSSQSIREARERLQFPVLVKPCRSSGSRGILRVNQPGSLTASVRRVEEDFGPVVVQEYLPKEGACYGVSMLFNQKGTCRAAFVHLKKRQVPDWGGPSTLREAVRYDEIRDTAISLMKKIGWQGIANVEFKVDTRDGIPKLLEINPRFWGSLQLAIDAGIDFPTLYFHASFDGDVEPAFNYRLGVQSQWLLPGDLRYLWHSKNRLKDALEILSPQGKECHREILRFGDPGPVIGQILSLFPLYMHPHIRAVLHNKHELVQTPGFKQASPRSFLPDQQI